MDPNLIRAPLRQTVPCSTDYIPHYDMLEAVRRGLRFPADSGEVNHGDTQSHHGSFDPRLDYSFHKDLCLNRKIAMAFLRTYSL